MKLLPSKRLLLALALVLVLILTNTGHQPSSNDDDGEDYSVPATHSLDQKGMVPITYHPDDGAIAYAGIGEDSVDDSEDGDVSVPGVIHLIMPDQPGNEPVNWTVTTDGGHVRALEWIPGTRSILWGDESGNVGILDTETGESTSRSIHHGPITSIVIPRIDTTPQESNDPLSPPTHNPTNSESESISNQNNRYCGISAVGSEDSTISIISLGNLSQQELLTDVGAPITSLDFSSNGSYLAAGGLGRDIIVYSTHDWKIIQRIPIPAQNWITAMSFTDADPSPAFRLDLLCIGYSSGTLTWYSIGAPESIMTTNLTAWANTLLFLEEESMMIAGGMDGNVTLISIDDLWEPSEDRQGNAEGVRSVIELEHPVASLGLSSFGYDFSTCDTNGTLSYWTVEDALPVEESSDPEPYVANGEYTTDSTGAFLAWIILVITLGSLVGTVTFIMSNNTGPKEFIPRGQRQIPLARLIDSPSIPISNGRQKASEPERSASHDPGKKQESKVINIFIKDSVINRSNLMLDEEFDEDADGEEERTIDAEYHV